MKYVSLIGSENDPKMMGIVYYARTKAEAVKEAESQAAHYGEPFWAVMTREALKALHPHNTYI
jgi:hypothetical protein